jgi:hypothetical protein
MPKKAHKTIKSLPATKVKNSNLIVHQGCVNFTSKTSTTKTVKWSSSKRGKVLDYVTYLQKELKLLDWEITVDFTEPALDGAVATMSPFENQRKVVLQFGDEFLNQTEFEIQQTLVHELLHCHFFALHHSTEATVESLAGKKGLKAYAPSLNSLIESATDIMADAIAPLLLKKFTFK